MAQIFVSAGHGGLEDGVLDPGYVLPTTTEADEMKQLRDLVVVELRSQGFDTEPVPNELSAAQTLSWINDRCRPEDVALELHTGAFPGSDLRGSAVFYLANNETRKTQAELVLMPLRQSVPQLPSRGVKPDSEFVGSASFCRQLGCPSLLMEAIVITNAADLELLQTQQRDFAIGIANGLKTWSNQVNSPSIPEGSTTIAVNVNGLAYPEPGLIISDQSYVPIDVAGLLRLSPAQLTDIPQVTYGNVTYIRAADLRNYNVEVGWQAATRTVLLRPLLRLPLYPGRIDLIMGQGATGEEQLSAFLNAVNPNAANRFRDLPRLYREEASVEGINYDIAFAQMLVETKGLTDSELLAKNNFGDIGSAAGDGESATFPSARIGVRAQIQHLKAYASLDSLVLPLEDPRFSFVQRGIAPLVRMLSDRWNAEPGYGDQIMTTLQRLYKGTGFLL